jgi:hypothetical protein
MILNTCGFPTHPEVVVARTDMFASAGDEELLTAVNEGIVPVPLAAKPIEVLSLVQLYDTF